jgi:hypothetical protein
MSTRPSSAEIDIPIESLGVRRAKTNNSFPVQLYPVARLMVGKEECSVQRAILYKPARNFRIVDLEHRIDKFDEFKHKTRRRKGGTSDLLYKEGSSTDTFA